MEKKRPTGQSELATFVSGRLAQLGMRQSEFCRLNGFDQGLLSKIQGSIITNLSLESVLRLALGLGVRPTRILELTGRLDLHELVLRSYAGEAVGSRQ
jgi:hypothetical protein